MAIIFMNEAKEEVKRDRVNVRGGQAGWMDQ